MNRSPVLIVEDDLEARAALAEVVEAEGYQTELACNGAEAIDYLEGSSPPLAVLVDLRMPGIVGQELLEYMRGDARLAAVPVAIFSASPELAPSGYPAFQKPRDLHRLIAFLRTSSPG